MHGKCPYCDRSISKVKIEAVDLEISYDNNFKGVTYNCPHCQKVLSVGPDFLAFKENIASAVIERLRG